MNKFAHDVVVGFGERLRELDEIIRRGEISLEDVNLMRAESIRAAIEHTNTVPQELPMREPFRRRARALHSSGIADPNRSYQHDYGGLRVVMHEMEFDEHTILRVVLEAPEDEVRSAMRGDLYLFAKSGKVELALGALGDYYYPNALHLTTGAGSLPILGVEVVYEGGELSGFMDTVHPEAQMALSAVELFPIDPEKI